jgi:NADPH:quinone reductase-like Zn-dependent oxidoreductase
LALSHGVEAVA